MNKYSRIYIAGHLGLVGSAITRRLTALGYRDLITRTRKELDLLNQRAVVVFLKKERPEFIFLAAAKVGGILANSSYPAQFIYGNLQVQNNIIHQAYLNGVKKLLFLGSSCIYPRGCPQPIKEEYLLSGALEQTNEPYAVAKIAGIKMCQGYRKQYGANFISIMPTNLYGPNDNFDPDDSHVVPALIGKFHKAKTERAKTVTVWGTGKPKREFLHVNDLAGACIHLMNNYDHGDIINVGSGKDISIRQLAETVKKITGFQGKIIWDETKPDGTQRKLLDIGKIKSLGWQPRIDLEKGLAMTYKWYLKNKV